MARRLWAIWDLLLKAWYVDELLEEELNPDELEDNPVVFKDKSQALIFVDDLNYDQGVSRFTVKQYSKENKIES
tara:strand:- start:540 stop:761 length:222 start_codon:yes stop_codon:yes gene_type:complete